MVDAATMLDMPDIVEKVFKVTLGPSEDVWIF